MYIVLAYWTGFFLLPKTQLSFLSLRPLAGSSTWPVLYIGLKWLRTSFWKNTPVSSFVWRTDVTSHCSLRVLCHCLLTRFIGHWRDSMSSFRRSGLQQDIRLHPGQGYDSPKTGQEWAQGPSRECPILAQRPCFCSFSTQSDKCICRCQNCLSSMSTFSKLWDTILSLAGI